MSILDNPCCYQLSTLTIFNIKKVKSGISKLLDLSPEHKILDICCGTGNFADLSKGEYVGFDMNERYISYARRRFKDDKLKQFLVSDIRDFEFRQGYFDIVLLIGVLHHLPDDAALYLLEKVNTTAKGRIIIIDPAIETRNPFSKLLRSLDRGEFIRPFNRQRSLISGKLNIIQYGRMNFGLNKMNAITCAPKKSTAP